MRRLTQPIIQNFSRILSNFLPPTLKKPSPLPSPSTFDIRNIATSPVPNYRNQNLHSNDSIFGSEVGTEEILESFEALESTLGKGDEMKYGLACLKVAQHLDSIGFEDRQKTLDFADKAFRILNDHGGDDEHRSIKVVMALHVLGSVNYGMKRFDESLGFLNKADKILVKCQRDSESFDAKPIMLAIQLQLATTKTAMGRREEAILHLRRCLDLKIKMFGSDSTEVGAAYRDLAEAYVAIIKFKEALPLCLKAMENHAGKLGSNSVEIAHCRRLLGVIYTGLEEHHKALEQNQLSQKLMKNLNVDSDFNNAKIEAANIQIALEKYDDAITTLKNVMKQVGKSTEEEDKSRTKVSVYITMARALCYQEKSVDAKRCLEIASEILKSREENDQSPELSGEIAEGYTDIAEIYEKINDFDIAISLLKKSICLFDKIPQEIYAQANAYGRIGMLLLMTGKAEEATPYLKNAVEGLKESFGPKHYTIGYAYKILGIAYMDLDLPESAAQVFAIARDIIDDTLGCDHRDSINLCQHIANAYDSIGNYDVAIEFQKLAIDGWSRHGPNAEELLELAQIRMEDFQKKIAGPGRFSRKF